MARERTIHTAADGSLYYELTRSRTIEVPGTKGLKIKETKRVPQLPSEGDPDEILQSALNMVDGKNDQERVEKLVGIINAGLVADATTAIQAQLNKAINANQVVSDFANIVTLTKSMFPDLSDGDRASMIMEKFPEIANKLRESGLEPASDDDDDENDDE